MRGVRFISVLGVLFSLLLILTGCSNSDQVKVGADAPDFTLADAQGGEVSLSEFSGQPVLLFFHMAVG